MGEQGLNSKTEKRHAHALSQKTASQVKIKVSLKCVSQNPQPHPKSLRQMYPMVDYLKCHGKTDALIPCLVACPARASSGERASERRTVGEPAVAWEGGG